MGLRINTNVLAMNAQHNLQKSTMRLQTSLQRLSTGLRINSGKDDVIGLAKSESLRTQIRGIAAAELNLANGANLLGVAEGTLAQLTDIAQRLREQTVQAADSTISSTDRENLNTNITDLVNEYSRLTSAAEFDGVKLLTGTFVAKRLQVGPNGTDTISISINDTRTSAIGKVAIMTAETLSVVHSTTTAGFAFTNPSAITINGVSINAATEMTGDGVSAYEATESAIAWVNLINNYAGQTGVSAVVVSNYVTLDYTAGSDVSAGDNIYINGTAITMADWTGSGDDTAASAFATAINNISTQTGVTATIDTANNRITLAANDGRNISVLYSASADLVSNSSVFGIQNSSKSDIGVMYRSQFKLFSDDQFSVGNADAEFATSDSVTQGLSSTSSLSTLNVSSTTNAVEGLFILDNVIRQLQARRSDVGSKTIRFQVAEGELQVRKENLTSSESRIRDADIAVETANLTSAQILQQAGASVLQRANAAPQIALTLLQQ